jgi:hypothetical protein
VVCEVAVIKTESIVANTPECCNRVKIPNYMSEYVTPLPWKPLVTSGPRVFHICSSEVAFICIFLGIMSASSVETTTNDSNMEVF